MTGSPAGGSVHRSARSTVRWGATATSCSPGTVPDVAGGALARRLGLGDAVLVGLGSMLGAGVFSVFGPAARAAGGGLLLGLALAAAVAWCNAQSTARLATRYPEAGGAYVYGRERLGPGWGHLAGWGFVVGKTASCAAVGLTFGTYAWPGHGRALAAAAVIAMTGATLAGIRRTALLNRGIVAVVAGSLAVAVAASWAGGQADAGRLLAGATSPHGVLQAAGLLFFAFAGYARLATLGEEVVRPERTIPRAIPLALGLALLTYLAVATAVLAVLGAMRLGRSPAPLQAAVATGSWSWAGPVIRVGAVAATLGVLLSLLLGVSRTALAMARHGELPRLLANVDASSASPRTASVAVGVVVVSVVALADVRGAIGFSSTCVLAYYAVANASAWTLGGTRLQRTQAGAGLLGCLVLAANLPVRSLLAGVAVLAVGVLVRRVAGRRSPGGQAEGSGP